MINKIKYLVYIFRTASLIKTLRFNIHYFGIKSSFKLPVLIGKRTELRKLAGKVNVLSPRRFGIQIGVSPLPITHKKDASIFFNSGTITFNEQATLHQGASIWNQGQIYIGKCTTFTGHCEIICRKKIEIGDKCLIAWGCQLMDSDHHIIENENGIQINHDKDIIIEDNIWIGSNCTILKGTHISKGAVLASKSIISNKRIPSNCVVANQGKILKRDIRWKN